MKTEKLGDLNIQIVDGDRGTNYPKEKDFSDRGFCLFLNAKNVTKNGFKFDTCQFISENKDIALGNGKLIRNDIVLTTRGTVGNTAYYSEKIPYKNIRINSGMVILRNHNSGIDNSFLMYILTSPTFSQQIDNIASGSAQPQLTVKTINNLKINYPTLINAQRRIARILSTCDAVIEKTQSAIAKYKAIKQGMLHDLFTRGININTCKLRPKYEDAPELYKENKLGWVPVDWEVEQLSLNIEVINGGTPTTHIKEYWNGEIPWLSVDDFNNSERFVSTAHKKITTEGLKNSSTNLLMPGMIIISARGTVGVISQLKIAMAFNQSCYGLNSINTKIHNDYLYYFLMYYKQDFGFRSFGSVFSTITRDYFDAMFIPFNLNSIEQEIIVNKISTIDQNLSTEEKYMHKLQKLKQGLMGDLLSGRRSVNADSAVNEPADTLTNNVII